MYLETKVFLHQVIVGLESFAIQSNKPKVESKFWQETSWGSLVQAQGGDHGSALVQEQTEEGGEAHEENEEMLNYALVSRVDADPLNFEKASKKEQEMNYIEEDETLELWNFKGQINHWCELGLQDEVQYCWEKQSSGWAEVLLEWTSIGEHIDQVSREEVVSQY